MQIHIFKTSVQTRYDLELVASTLDHLVQKPGRWNFDLEDCDHVLRVESALLESEVIIKHVTTAGFTCCELPD